MPRIPSLPAALAAVLLLLPGCVQGSDALLLAVAANFRATAEIVATRFTAAHDHDVRLVSASTGVLTAQLERGAPFDVFLAADAQAPDRLLGRGIGVPGSDRCYAQGQLVLLGSDNLRCLGERSLSLAIANAATAPYGAAAEAVLARPEFAGAAGRRILRGSNVLQAYQFFRAGGAELALVARSLTPGQGLPVPREWHAPIAQHRLVIAESDPVAQAFVDFLDSATVAPVLAAAGYLPCP